MRLERKYNYENWVTTGQITVYTADDGERFIVNDGLRTYIIPINHEIFLDGAYTPASAGLELYGDRIRQWRSEY